MFFVNDDIYNGNRLRYDVDKVVYDELLAFREKNGEIGLKKSLNKINTLLKRVWSH